MNRYRQDPDHLCDWQSSSLWCITTGFGDDGTQFNLATGLYQLEECSHGYLRAPAFNSPNRRAASLHLGLTATAERRKEQKD